MAFLLSERSSEVIKSLFFLFFCFLIFFEVFLIMKNAFDKMDLKVKSFENQPFGSYWYINSWRPICLISKMSRRQCFVSFKVILETAALFYSLLWFFDENNVFLMTYRDFCAWAALDLRLQCWDNVSPSKSQMIAKDMLRNKWYKKKFFHLKK